MQSWIKIIPIGETTTEGTYFIGRRWIPSNDQPPWCDFLCELKSGKRQWASKPGIAIRVKGGEKLIEYFAANSETDLIAIEVPPNKKWSRRK